MPKMQFCKASDKKCQCRRIVPAGVKYCELHDGRRVACPKTKGRMTKKTTKKYSTRPSPAYPANSMCGKVRKGNDGNYYISKADKNGVCRWVIRKKL